MTRRRGDSVNAGKLAPRGRLALASPPPLPRSSTAGARRSARCKDQGPDTAAAPARRVAAPAPAGCFAALTLGRTAAASSRRALAPAGGPGNGGAVVCEKRLGGSGRGRRAEGQVAARGQVGRSQWNSRLHSGGVRGVVMIRAGWSRRAHCRAPWRPLLLFPLRVAVQAKRQAAPRVTASGRGAGGEGRERVQEEARGWGTTAKNGKQNCHANSVPLGGEAA